MLPFAAWHLRQVATHKLRAKGTSSTDVHLINTFLAVAHAAVRACRHVTLVIITDSLTNSEH